MQTRVILAYQSFENEFLNFLEVVPYEKQNKDTWSPKLVSILQNCCRMIDSIFKASVPPNTKPKKEKKFTIEDYREIFSQKLGLSTSRCLVYISPPFFLEPFNEWQSPQNPQPPKWWSVHNRIKHDGLANMHLATVDTTLIALCGLFGLIAKHHEMSAEILRHQWLNRGGVNPSIVLEDLSKENREVELQKRNNGYLVHSKLFVTTIGRPFPSDIQEIRPIVYPDQRLSDFLGKWY
jgi:hypothetical protein